MDDFKRCLKGDEELSTSKQPDVPVISCWKPPPKGTIKVNFDAAINKNFGSIGVGLIDRDYLGNLKGAKRFSISLPTDSYNVELMAASHAAIYCTQVGFLECDI
jgi:hypothetical protein